MSKLCEEAEMNFALLQSTAVWDPKKLVQFRNGVTTPTREAAPKSVTEYLELMKQAHG